MEKRVIIAMLLSVAVLAVYQMLMPPPAAPVQQPPSAPPTAGAADPAAAAPPPAPTQAAAQPKPSAARPMAAPIVADAAARNVVVESDAFIATFNSAGAVLTSWRLKSYRDNKGAPLELVPEAGISGQPRPFTIATDNPAESGVLASALYKPSAEGLSLGANPGTLRFQYQDASGLTAEKAFHFQKDGHPFQVTLEASVEVGAAPRPVTVHWGPAIGVFDPAVPQTTPPRVVQFRGSPERIAPASISTQPTYEGALRFAGVEDHYFVVAAVPGATASKVEYSALSIPVVNAPGTMHTLVAFSVTPKAEGTPSRTVTLPFYIGPKEIDRLREVDPLLVNAIDFGMFRWLVRPLLDALKWINRYLHNFGWSIIALTVLINILIFPLRHRSMVSMRKMQSLQPQVKAIQDRYKHLKFTDPDRQKMNQEMLGLYKQHGVNPASGCVPMLLTMPILFAFYAMLSVAIELRGAPFMGWIADLSAKDPLYITPIIMGGTMFWQQRMMPASTDPTQAKIFMFMPIIFTVMFLSMPSGLVLYWTASNLLTIGQQVLTNRMIARPAKPSRPTRKA
jgi:YidC/Oxa1 family membrane protein insertase